MTYEKTLTGFVIALLGTFAVLVFFAWVPAKAAPIECYSVVSAHYVEVPCN